MKKIFILLSLASSLLLISCGANEEDMRNVCGCEDLYLKMRSMKGEYQINDRISSSEAEKKVQAEFQTEFDKCTKLHKDLSEDTYFKLSQKCGTK